MGWVAGAGDIRSTGKGISRTRQAAQLLLLVLLVFTVGHASSSSSAKA
jgi:hypothetical protein